ncbi:hypothetical protein CCACVL1_20623 [Corchorus capsularis]|uniref:Uncharacterized protein n=1 Tax=Corchorus capsularis TaxID=210143 RepID=A0A1R3HAC1_COCAP|nr:hypothetical protein CCACVL1_20623 [Corchorus capsularis]
MPGIIQVSDFLSVLDFKGHDSASAPSQISVKVSMGKAEYQTWDKGDFSFPLTTLRDNLTVTLEDAEGNKISHTGVETRLVMEKGVWDDIFPFEGGGHVHMKLQFVLSEEERQKVRIMRESALKKKHEELCNSGHASPKNASVGYKDMSGSQESLLQSGLVANEVTLGSIPLKVFKDGKFDIDNKDGSYSIQKEKSTIDINGKEGNSSSKSKPDSVPSEPEKVNKSRKQGPVGKANSNVMKMISAFEGSVNQDKPSIKPPPSIKPETRKIGVDSFIANPHSNEVDAEKIIPPNATLRRVNTKEFEQRISSNRGKMQTIGSAKSMYASASSKEMESVQAERKLLDLKNRFILKQKESDMKEEKKYSEDFRRASTMEKAAFSRKMLDKHSKSNQSWNSFSKKQHSSKILVTQDGGEETFHKDPPKADGISNGKLKSAATWSNGHCSNRSSGLWIFPGETNCLCITAGGKKIMDLMGGFWDETNTTNQRTGEVDSDDDQSIEQNEDGKTSSQKLRPKLENSMDREGQPIGPFRQVIKVVIMVGFATLVVLTRKKT